MRETRNAIKGPNVILRLWCRLVGHKWTFMPGVSHGHDALFECARCGGYDWRDEPLEAAGAEQTVCRDPQRIRATS